MRIELQRTILVEVSRSWHRDESLILTSLAAAPALHELQLLRLPLRKRADCRRCDSNRTLPCPFLGSARERRDSLRPPGPSASNTSRQLCSLAVIKNVAALARAGACASKSLMRICRLLLYLYPASFRADYGGEMEAVFRVHLRDAWCRHGGRCGCRRCRGSERSNSGTTVAVHRRNRMCSKRIGESPSIHSFRVMTRLGGALIPEYQGVLGSPPSCDVVVR